MIFRLSDEDFRFLFTLIEIPVCPLPNLPSVSTYGMLLLEANKM